MTVLDVGAGANPDPRADVTADCRADAPVHHVFDAENEKWPFDDGELSGVVARHVVEHLEDPSAFFAEAGRVIGPGGWLEIRVPLGASAWGDPDHEHAWAWLTPTVFCREQQRPWDDRTPFRLTNRKVDVWLLPPLHWLTPLWQRFANRWPAFAVQHTSDGELIAEYERVRT